MAETRTRHSIKVLDYPDNKRQLCTLTAEAEGEKLATPLKVFKEMGISALEANQAPGGAVWCVKGTAHPNHLWILSPEALQNADLWAAEKNDPFEYGASIEDGAVALFEEFRRAARAGNYFVRRTSDKADRLAASVYRLNPDNSEVSMVGEIKHVPAGKKLLKAVFTPVPGMFPEARPK